jgi:hypothetical protein
MKNEYWFTSERSNFLAIAVILYHGITLEKIMRKRKMAKKSFDKRAFIKEMTHFLSHLDMATVKIASANVPPGRKREGSSIARDGLAEIVDRQVMITASLATSPQADQTLIRIDKDLLRSINSLLDRMAAIHAKYGCPFDIQQVYRCIGASLMWIEERRHLGFEWTADDALRLIAADLLNHLHRCLAQRDRHDSDSPKPSVGFWPNVREMCL